MIGARRPTAATGSIMARRYRIKRLYQQVADKLMAMIEAGRFPPGSRLPAERKLAETFGVSRPTVREAIIALELAGYVEVRVGSGVYVLEPQGQAPAATELDVGPFELTEARILFEGEAAALAATLITDEEIAQLEEALAEIAEANERAPSSEVQDRKFHMLIAQATRNSAIVSVIDELWEWKMSSPLNERIFQKVRELGYRPRIDEHRAIIDALRRRDPQAARAAMHEHLGRLIDELLDATEIEALEEARRRVSRERERFTLARRLG
ncbi:MAG: GntR family transcriptional regulator [Gammaproteobacteria bacterium]|nr:MAG: GntR family transcriptional regulator [Gammaproteobacteria bacterium]